MKKIVYILLTIILSITLISCNKVGDNEINVGVAFYPMKDILELIKDDVENEGYKLNIHEFTDYQVPNNLLKSKELDANMIQHKYFLEQFNKANNSNLEIVLPIYYATYALYSKDLKNVDDIVEGSNITLPDDITNISRALYLLHQAGIITLNLEKEVFTENDIISNPKNITFNDKVPLTSLSNKYVETKLAVMYPTYALNLKLEGDSERLFVEEFDDFTKDFAISLAARSDNKNSDKIQVLIKYIKSEKVRNFLNENYSWASTPAV